MAQKVNVGVQSEGRLMKAMRQEETHAGRGLLAAPRRVCRSCTGGRESGVPNWRNCERNLGGKEQGLFIVKLA